MAFDHDGFFAVVGKRIKAIDVWYSYIAAIESHKVGMQDILETEDLTDLYVTLPPMISAMQDNVTSWIQALIADVSNLFQNRTYVIEQLNVSEYTNTAVLNAIYDYMVANGESIKPSIVTLGGSDANLKSSGSGVDPQLFCCRILDGVNDPGNGITAHKRYLGVESQLARSTTVKVEVTADTPGQETAKVYSSGPVTGPYVLEDEEPGNGSDMTTIQASSIVVNGFFNGWTDGEPNSWSVTGTKITDYVDSSGTGLGPLKIITTGIKASQQVPSGQLQKNRMYFAGVHFAGLSNGVDTDQVEVLIRIRNLSGTIEYATPQSTVLPITIFSPGSIPYEAATAFLFFYLDDNVDLNNVYVEVEAVEAPTESGSGLFIQKVVVAPAVYYNGLAWAWWPVLAGWQGVISYVALAPVGHITSMAIVNGDQGVIQRYFRKAHNIQLPTNDSPTIADTLAT